MRQIIIGSAIFLWCIRILVASAQASAPKTDSILRIFQQSHQTQESGFCFDAQVFITSQFLKGLSSRLINHTRPQLKEIRDEFLKIVLTPQNFIFDIDQKSSYLQQVVKNKLDFLHEERPSKFAGGDPKHYKLPIDLETKQVLTSLFSQVERNSSSWNITRLSRSDLFHAHLVYNQSLEDLFLLFHAKEYPNGNPALCETCPIRRLLMYFSELPPVSVQSAPPSVSYLRRNFVWSLKRSIICGVNTTNTFFSSLAQEDGDGSTLDESKLSDLGEAGELATLNYFPNEGVPLFFDFLRL